MPVISGIVRARAVVALCATLVLSSIGVQPRAYADAKSDSLQYAKGLSEAFEHAAEIITPSVVNISAVERIKPVRRPGMPGNRFRGNGSPDPFRDFFGDDFFDRFFGDQGGDGGGPTPQAGLGTGVIVDSNGSILTNNHVVGHADELTVRLQDGRTFKAEVVGTDPRTDLAVIKVKASGLTPAKLGDSSNLKIGEWVVAAGNPFGLDNTITAGIVSAKGRSIMGGNQYEDFIQTDAAINPGNSGGPLVNLQGEVIGINTAIFSRSGGYMGIGFAIPVDMVKRVMKSLISSGKVVRGWLGVGIQNLTEDMAKSFGFTGSEGALVGDVQENSPAAKAGIAQGDIIVAIDGRKIENSNQLRNLVADLAPGQNVDIAVYREGQKKTVSLVIGEQPSQLSNEEEPQGSDETPAESLGLQLQSLTPDIAKRLGTKHTKGVVVMDIKPDGVGAAAGLQRGDIILSVNGKKVGSTADFKGAVDKASLSKGIRMVVETQGMERFVFLKTQE